MILVIFITLASSQSHFPILSHLCDVLMPLSLPLSLSIYIYFFFFVSSIVLFFKCKVSVSCSLPSFANNFYLHPISSFVGLLFYGFILTRLGVRMTRTCPGIFNSVPMPLKIAIFKASENQAVTSRVLQVGADMCKLGIAKGRRQGGHRQFKHASCFCSKLVG